MSDSAVSCPSAGSMGHTWQREDGSQGRVETDRQREDVMADKDSSCGGCNASVSDSSSVSE